MKRILYLLFLLSLPFVAFAQYPNAPNKIVLGRQTTGDGLIFRTNGQPSWTPATAANAWMALDTLTGNIWIYRNNEWFLQVAGDLKLDYPLVINKSSVNILQGQVVMVDTVQLVQGDRVRVRPAIATMTNAQYIMGVASEDIPNDSTGYITWFGYVREVDHADIAQTGVTLDVGDILYISATEAGKYTDTEPAAPNVNATIALVVRKPNANNMTLLVRPWLNEKLGDLSDVDLSGIANGQSIAWDSINRKFIPATFGTGSGTGTVTSITAGAGLTGGTITTSGTIAADTATVLASKIWVQTRGYLTSEVDGSITNEGVLGVGAGGANTAVITSNTSTAAGVTLSGGVGVSISETTSSNGGTIAMGVDTAVIATVSAVRDTATVLRSLLGSSNLKGNGLSGTVTFWSAIDTLTFDSSFTYNASTNILGLPALGKYQIGGTTVAYLADNGSLFLGDGGASAASAFYNFGAGIQSLQSLTSGDRNTAAGYQSMRLATTAIDNTAFGYQALHDATTANYNAAFGYRPLFNNIAGLGNVAIGYESLFTVDSTNYNVGIGNYSLYYAKSTGNTAVGHSSSGFNVSGDYNTALGYQALYRNVGGDNNVALGRDAGLLWQTGVSSNFNQEPQNSVYIGYNTRAGAAGQTNEIVIGTNAIGNGSHTATIGSDSINATFLKGQLKLPMYATNDFSGTAVKYLAVDSDGDVIEVDPITGGGGVGGSGLTNKVAYWSNDTTLTYDTNFHFDPTNDRLGIGTATPGFPLTVNGRIGISSTQMLYLPGGNFTGTMFVGNGGSSLSYTSGDQGRFNTFGGIDAGLNITTGRNSTGFGYNSTKVTSGTNNTGFGSNALANVTGSDDNTAIGFNSLPLIDTGDAQNTAVGSTTFLNLSNGSNNIAIGYQAGRYAAAAATNLNTANSTILIGRDARPNANSQTNQIVIGDQTVGNGSNTTTIGNASTTATHLRGQLKLEEYGDTTFVGTAVKYLGVTDSGDVIEVDAPTGGGGGGVGGSGLANKVAYWTNDSTLTYNTQFHFNPSLERLGIGTSAPAEKIEAIGNIRSTLGRVLVNTTGSQVIHVSNRWVDGGSPGFNVWVGTGGEDISGADESGYNTAIGYDAMLEAGIVLSNTAAGYAALKNQTTGSSNTAVGSNALELNTGSIYSVAVGAFALNNSLDSLNTAVGTYSLTEKVKGKNNVALGYLAGSVTGTGDTINNSVFLGASTSAAADNGTNEIVIGYNTTGDGSNTTVIGNDSITSTKLKGQLKLPQYATNNYSGTVSKYLAVDASGNVIEADGTTGGGGGVGGTGLTNKVAYWSNDSTLTYDTNLHYDPTNDRLGIQNATPGFPLTVNGKIGVDTMQVVYYPGAAFPGTLIYGNAGANMINTKGSENTIVGDGAAYNLTSGIFNTIVGRDAAKQITTAEADNAFGWQALRNITSGSYNNAFGNSALSSATTALYNSAFGDLALYTNATSNFNSAFGASALYANTAASNSAFGSFALGANSTAANNTAVGANSLSGITTGDNNVAVGFDAGRRITAGSANTTGTRSVMIGSGARASANGNSNEIAIGFAVRGNGSNTVTIGNDTITATHLKGQLKLPQYATNNFTGTPAKLLAVDASGNVIEVDTTGSTSSGIGGTVAANKVAFGAPSGDTLTSNTNLHWDNTNARLGIGTSSPAFPLHVMGRIGIMTNSASPIAEFGTNDGGSNNNLLYIIPTYGNGVVGSNGMYFQLQSPADLGFRTTSSGIANMTINSTGNVGIGTTSPVTKLHLNTTSEDNKVRIETNTSGNSVLELLNTGNQAYSFTADRANNFLKIHSTVYDFITMNASTGNVGIGTTSPGTPLDVKAAPANGIAYRLRGRGADGVGLIQFTDSLASTQYATIGTPAANTLAFGTASTERMRITSAGNVAIGNTTGAERLHVSGNVRMTGNLQRAAPVTVAASTHTLAETTSWLIINNAGTCTVTLPAASSWTGREVTIKTITANAVVSASSNVVPIDSATAGTAILPATDGAWAKLVSDGTNWIIMQKG